MRDKTRTPGYKPENPPPAGNAGQQFDERKKGNAKEDNIDAFNPPNCDDPRRQSIDPALAPGVTKKPDKDAQAEQEAAAQGNA